MNFNFAKRGLPLAVIAGLMVSVFALTGAATSDDQEISEIQQAIIGIEEVQVQMGMFRSEDGLTASMSQNEVEHIASQFDEKVDQYYAKGTYVNTFYKWLNRDLLFNTFRSKVDNCVDGGVFACDIESVVFSEDGTEATVDAQVTTWNKWVTQEEDGSYQISNPVCRDAVKLKLGKEADEWKLQETLSLELGEEGHDPTVASTDLQQTNQAMNQDNQAILDEIQETETLLSAKYESYQDARDAVLSIDVERSNYFALR